MKTINEKLVKHLIAGFTALVAFITYAMTMAPTVSFWDCGEFVACANTLGIPHPPGTPFFVLLSRVVILILPMVAEIAKRINYISVVSSAATVYLVTLFAWDLLSKILSRDAFANKLSTSARYIVLGTAALVAGFLLTFSDTFWFSAVEAEVYGLAMFILMLISYLGLVWVDHQNESKGDRILVFICYLAFLGVGAHLYTMLTIPAIFVLLLISDPKKIGQRIPLWITGAVLCSVIYAVGDFIILSLLTFAVLGIFCLVKPFNSDVMKNVRLSFAFAVVALLGFSTHLYIPIRSELNPIIDENNPEINIRDEQGNLQLGNLFKSENWTAFNDFIERKQYGSESMLSRAFYRRAQFSHQLLSFPNMGYGGYQIAQYLPFKVGGVNFSNTGAYSFDASENAPLEKFGMTFPTQMQAMGDNTFMQFVWFLLFNGAIVFVCVFAYKRNRNIGIYTSVLYALCSLGLFFYINFADGTRMEQRERDYWVQAMTRNVSDLNRSGLGLPEVPDPNDLIDARQKVEQASMDVSRLRYQKADPARIASAEQLKSEAENAPVWQNWRQIENAYARIGQAAPFPEAVHLEVRERDYFYTPAFIFMSLLLGLGAGILVFLLATASSAFFVPAAAAFVILSSVIPCLSNYQEHDRSGLWVPWDYAYNLLNSCRPNAILFTNGDNDTFPLWFAQEVAGIRKDVRVVNLSLGNTDWYIKQMLVNEPILKLSYDAAAIDRDMVISDGSDRNPIHYTSTWVEKANHVIPVLQMRIANAVDSTGKVVIDSTKLLQYKVMLQVYTAFKEWQERTHSSLMLTQHKLVMDLAMSNPDRPLHFSTTVGMSNFLGLEKYMVQEGMIYNFVQGDTTDRRNNGTDFDMQRTAFLIDSVYRYRGLGDGSAYINNETLRLLSSYSSLYLQIAFQVREEIVALRKSAPFTESKKKIMDEKVKFALHYLDMGITQFPKEWRCYWAASFVLEAAQMKQEAIHYAEKGLANISDYDEQGRVRLQMNMESLRALPDQPEVAVPDSVVIPPADSTKVK